MDPYNILGVDRNATPDDIKTAYRKLANKHHPDRGGSTQAFQEVQAAYDILSDPQKRAAYDNPMQAGDPFGGFNPFEGFGPFGDIFSQFMNQSRTKIYTVTVFVTLEQIVAGSVENVHINTPGGPKLVQLQIPKNIEDGNQVRYEGIMPDGFLQVLFRIHKHPVFTRRGLDLYSTEQVNILELITGTSLVVKDIHGKTLELAIPPMTKPGSRFRMAGRGIPGGGDQYVLIEAVLPDKIGPDTLSAIKTEVERTRK